MAKVIKEMSNESGYKMVEIKHLRTMENASGKDVEVVDYTEQISLDEAIAQTESKKARLDAEVVAIEAELVDLNAIKDA
tara:strand:- start:3070 stop:3306 length:237 start_codon:yes stop_codon:yes gene_type:complete